MSDPTSTRFDRIEALFELVIDAPEGERSQLLRDACADDKSLRAEVLSLVEADKQDLLVTGGALQFVEDGLGAGSSIGRYRLIEEIGSGGMSRVFRARRTDVDYEQDVAVKLMRAFGTEADESERRFAIEQRVLGSLSHPNIARIFDSGVAKGNRPYLVMEYVKGESLLTYCDRHKLDLSARLDLFVNVCSAVAHAHQRLVVHRDIKPSNILVHDDGHVKLLDFGIAKLLDIDADVTRTGLAMLTPQYAAPEQLLGGVITTATDIYALGLVLFELISGEKALPSENTSAAARLRMVCEQVPEKVSLSAACNPIAAGWAPQLRGDLDLVVAKTLAKEPTQRYASCRELIVDVRRWQRGRPVRAHAPTWGYFARKFIRRNWLGVATAAVFFAVVTGFAIALVIQNEQALAERDRALAAESRTNDLNRFLADEVLGAVTPQRAQGREVRVADMLDAASAAAGQSMQDEPALQATIRSTLARTYRQLGNLEAAELHARSALGLLDGIVPRDDPERLRILHEVANVARVQGKLDEALKLATSAYRYQVSSLGPQHRDALSTQILLGQIHVARADWPAAESELTSALTALGDADPESAQLRLTALSTLIQQYTQQRRYNKAYASLLQLMPLQQQRLGKSHPDTIATLAQYAEVAHRTFRTDEAIMAAREAYTRSRDVYGSYHPDIAETVTTLGRVLWRARRYTEAELLFRDNIAGYTEALGSDHPVVPHMISRLAVLLSTSGQLDEAERLYRQAIPAHIAIHGQQHPDTLRVMKNFTSLLSRLGNEQERRVWVARIADIARSFMDETDVDPVQLSDMAEYLLECDPQDLRDPKAALSMVSRAVALSERQHPSPLIVLADALQVHGRTQDAVAVYEEVARLPDALRIRLIPRRVVELYRSLDQPERAEAFLREHLGRRRAAHDPDDPIVGFGLLDLAGFLVESDRGAEAEPIAREAVAIFSDAPVGGMSMSYQSQAVLGSALLAQRKFADAERALVSAFEGLRADQQVESSIKEKVANWVVELYKQWDRPADRVAWQQLLETGKQQPRFAAWQGPQL